MQPAKPADAAKEGAKGFEYSIDCLPEVTQQALRERYALQLMMQKADESPAPVVTKARRSPAVVDAVEAYRGSPQLMVERLNALTENQRKSGRGTNSDRQRGAENRATTRFQLR